MLKAIAVSLALITPAAETEDPCPMMGELAATIMENRQVGTPIDRMMEIANGQELSVALVLEAYSQPRYSTEEYRQRAVDDFANNMMTACYLAM